jgi:peptidoglycan/LPS O-acetylase OafA/YrhL
MRWRGFQVFTKISYAVYLTQFPIYFYNVGTTRVAGHSSISDLVIVKMYIFTQNSCFAFIQFVLSEVLTVLSASIILTLFVDLPFQEIKKILTEKEGKQ